MKDALMIEQPINIKCYEIDAVGIVSNIVYIKWFEDLRLQFLEKYYPFDEMIRDNTSPVLMKTEAQYLSPLRLSDKPTGRCWLSKLGSTKWEFTLDIFSGDKMHCRGKQTGCFFDIENQMADRVPERLSSAYNKIAEQA